jgi:hypothetical protein
MDPIAHYMILGSTRVLAPLDSRRSFMDSSCDKCQHRPDLRNGLKYCHGDHVVKIIELDENPSGKMIQAYTSNTCPNYCPPRTRFERILRNDYPL